MYSDCHIHIERGPYTIEWIKEFINQAQYMGLNEIYLLEHTHRFFEFKGLYSNIMLYNDFQRDWLSNKKMQSITDYINLIEVCKKIKFPISVKFGLEICYEPGKENLIKNITSNYNFDFLVVSIHSIDGFEYDLYPESWVGKNVNILYRRYYEITLEAINSNLFDGIAHPDAIKCFGHNSTLDMSKYYLKMALLINKNRMYIEDNGGLMLNYGYKKELGMNEKMRMIFKENHVNIKLASDAHIPEHVGKNIKSLSKLWSY